MVERCGDRQRKFDGLGRWPFRMFVESLPIMLQIALLLLACGLSRYMWLINTSVAVIVISFTSVGILFFIGIVAAGTSSYECPFQTPASIGLRDLGKSETVKRMLASLSPPKVVALIGTIWSNTRKELASAPYRFFEFARYPLSWNFSPSRTSSGIRTMATKVGHRTLILLLHTDQAFRNAKRRLVQEIRRFRRAGLLPTTGEDTHHRPSTPRNGPGLLVRVRNLEALRKQNTDDVHCVSWVLLNITDPEAIDSAIRLAGTIRWFDGDPNHNPPFGLVVSAFEACFDSTKQLHPGMRDRAYFSARAILQINLRARAQSRDHASKYPIPDVPLNTFQHTDPDLHHVIRMLECNSHSERPTLDSPRVGANSHNHSLWMSNLFVDLTRVGPNPILKSYESYLSAAVANHQATIANTLLMWYMFLGGHAEEETFWAADKSYAVNSLFFLPLTYFVVCQRFVGSHPLSLVRESDECYQRRGWPPTSQLPPGILGGMGETSYVPNSNGLRVVLCYLRGGRKTWTWTWAPTWTSARPPDWIWVGTQTPIWTQTPTPPRSPAPTPTARHEF